MATPIPTPPPAQRRVPDHGRGLHSGSPRWTGSRMPKRRGAWRRPCAPLRREQWSWSRTWWWRRRSSLRNGRWPCSRPSGRPRRMRAVRVSRWSARIARPSQRCQDHRRRPLGRCRPQPRPCWLRCRRRPRGARSCQTSRRNVSRLGRCSRCSSCSRPSSICGNRSRRATSSHSTSRSLASCRCCSRRHTSHGQERRRSSHSSRSAHRAFSSSFRSGRPWLMLRSCWARRPRIPGACADTWCPALLAASSFQSPSAGHLKRWQAIPTPLTRAPR
mmetsp:Transcript_90993/g.262315  ORF Transcript_90993/g.262315 Transcript_90993/m.262315 type:complete len:274 (+) Transcript_90993:975-1796(+)